MNGLTRVRFDSPPRIPYLTILAVLGLLGASAPAQDVEPSPSPTATLVDSSPFGGPFFERPKLTGDWFGLRSGLDARGVTVDVSSTQFYQGVASGGLSRGFPYGGRNDYLLNVDGEKLGLWKGFYVNIHGETRYGQTPNFMTGALSPVNEYLLVPGFDGTVSGLTGVKFSQHLGENAMVYAGKINLLYDLPQPLTGASGTNGFMNTSLLFNTIFARTLPYSTFGAGFVYLRDDHPVFSVSVYDANDTPATSGFESFFNNGVVIFGLVDIPTAFFGLPGHQGISGTYSSGSYTNVQSSFYLDPIAGLVVKATRETGSWAVAYHFDQAVRVSPEDPDRAWGVFGALGLADDNPNPVRWYASAGVAGASPIRARDTFGIGFFYLGVSEPLKENARPITPLGDENGVELYYNARVTPWFQVTPDLQVIRPFQQQASTAIVFGLRAKIDF